MHSQADGAVVLHATLDESAAPWNWPEEVWRRHVNAVRAGCRMLGAWPGNGQVAVALSFDADHETVSLRRGDVSPGGLSQGEYGARVGSKAILGVLREFGASATFFMPAVSALLHPGEAREYVAAGHEVAVHGWIHEAIGDVSGAEERRLMEQSVTALGEITGVAPRGVRTPSWDFSARTLPILRDVGFLYDSSLMADDDPYELLADGERTGLVEIPVEWIRDDFPYFSMARHGSDRPHMAPRHVFEIWRDEFDAAYQRGGVFQLTMHPHIIGHPSRLTVLRHLLDYIKSYPGVWWATHEEVAECVTAGERDAGSVLARKSNQ